MFKMFLLTEYLYLPKIFIYWVFLFTENEQMKSQNFLVSTEAIYRAMTRHWIFVLE